jgi:SSS family solute:Na+ symporter
MVAFGLLWIPNMGFVAGGLFKYIQSVQAYIAPPIAAVFLIGVLWPRANAVGAIATLLVGFVLGIGRLVLEIYQEDINGLALAVTQINFLHFAFLLFVISVIILILVSLATGRPDSSKTDGLTLGNGDGERTKGRAIDLVLSVGVVLLIGALWWIFSPLVLAQ